MQKAIDYSKKHGLVSPFIKWTQSQKEWEQYRLSQEQVDFFHENGYLANVKLLE